MELHSLSDLVSQDTNNSQVQFFLHLSELIIHFEFCHFCSQRAIWAKCDVRLVLTITLIVSERPVRLPTHLSLSHSKPARVFPKEHPPKLYHWYRQQHNRLVLTAKEKRPLVI
jgi:hypothetical protein